MALQLFDRVQVTATANTTVSFTLGTAVAGYQSFSVMTNGNTTYYGSSDGTNWEVGIGTYSSTGPTLTRTTILSSSNAGAAVTFTGTPNVWIDYPSSQSVYLNNNVVSVPTYVATQTVSGSSSTGAYSYGTLNGSDTGVMASFQTSIAGYGYVAIQNTSSNSAATTDFTLYNDTASLGRYFDIGINSTTYTGTGNFSLANASYIYSYGGDLSIGTYTSNAIHFIINNGATDALTISTAGNVTTPNVLTGAEVVASNGLILNNKTVSNSYTIPTGYNAIAVGPVTVASGAAVTIPSGSRWVVL